MCLWTKRLKVSIEIELIWATEVSYNNNMGFKGLRNEMQKAEKSYK